jgi:uncharacterized protein YxeA
MKRTIIAIIAVVTAIAGSVVAFTAITMHRIANMRLSQYAYDHSDNSPIGIDQ